MGGAVGGLAAAAAVLAGLLLLLRRRRKRRRRRERELPFYAVEARPSKVTHETAELVGWAWGWPARCLIAEVQCRISTACLISAAAPLPRTCQTPDKSGSEERQPQGSSNHGMLPPRYSNGLASGGGGLASPFAALALAQEDRHSLDSSRAAAAAGGVAGGRRWMCCGVLRAVLPLTSCPPPSLHCRGGAGA